MRSLVVFSLVLLAFALNCEGTVPVQLTGSNGQAILSQLEGSAQTVNLSTNTGLWDWGSIPLGYTLNNSGILTEQNVLSNIFGGWVPGI